MKRLLCSLPVIAGSLVAASAQAGIFTNVSVTGSLSSGATWLTTATDIDFTLPNAMVGDLSPGTSGSFTIKYDFADANPIDINTLFVLGALSGNGSIAISETVVDINTNNVIGSFNGTLTNASQLPFVTPVNLAPASNNIRVTKTFTLNAPNGNNLDLASVTLVEQRLNVVPEPATLTAVGLGIAALLRRRKRT